MSDVPTSTSSVRLALIVLPPRCGASAGDAPLEGANEKCIQN
jgi:hypothetical protein